MLSCYHPPTIHCTIQRLHPGSSRLPCGSPTIPLFTKSHDAQKQISVPGDPTHIAAEPRLGSKPHAHKNIAGGGGWWWRVGAQDEPAETSALPNGVGSQVGKALKGQHFRFSRFHDPASSVTQALKLHQERNEALLPTPGFRKPCFPRQGSGWGWGPERKRQRRNL